MVKNTPFTKIVLFPLSNSSRKRNITTNKRIKNATTEIHRTGRYRIDRGRHRIADILSPHCRAPTVWLPIRNFNESSKRSRGWSSYGDSWNQSNSNSGLRSSPLISLQFIGHHSIILPNLSLHTSRITKHGRNGNAHIPRPDSSSLCRVRRRTELES
jgi:hypothetical protein